MAELAGRAFITLDVAVFQYRDGGTDVEDALGCDSVHLGIDGCCTGRDCPGAKDRYCRAVELYERLRQCA